MREPTADRILDAVIELYIRRGREGVSVRPITKLAECSNVTVLKTFKNKDGLIEAAFRRELRDLDSTVPSPTGNLAVDLEELARRYYTFYVERPFIMLALADATRQPRLQKILREEQRSTVTALVYLYAEHRHQGSLRTDLDPLGPRELNETLSGPFLGGIFFRVLLTKAGMIEPASGFDAELYVQRFLTGWQRQ